MNPKFGRDLTTGSIPRHILTFSAPMLVGSFLQTAYSFINAIWVGQFLGTRALAAVTVSFPVIFVLFGVGMGMTLGTNILVSQNFGAKRFEELRRVVDSSTLLTYALGIAFAILGELFAPQILRAMDTPADVLPEAVSYLRVFMLSMPFAFGLFLIRSLLQGVGDSKTPLYFQLGSVILTTILDPVLIFGLGGFPKLGLDGTAWATLFSQILVLVALIAYLRYHKAPVAPAWPRLNHLGPTTGQLIRIGLPSAIQQSLVSIGMVMVTGIVNGFGEAVTAAFGAASRIDQIAFMPAVTFGMAISTLAGQNLGARKDERVRDIFKWGCLFSGAITGVISLAAVVFPAALLRIFVKDEAVIALGVPYLRIVGSCYMFFGLIFVSNGIINGAGATIVTTAFSLISLWIVRVPLALYLSRHLKSEVGIWYAISASFVLSFVISMAYYASGRWKRSLAKSRAGAKVETAPPVDAGVAIAHDVGEA
jgi:putative MATE family efflux protein